MPKIPIKSTADPVAALAELIYRHGTNFLDMPMTMTRKRSQLLRKTGLTEADLRPGLISRAEEEARQRFRKWLIDNNADPDRVLDAVLVGDLELDPDYNPDHPVRGRAWGEKQVAQREEVIRNERFAALKQKRAAENPKPPPSPPEPPPETGKPVRLGGSNVRPRSTIPLLRR